ncbi:transcriptional regulator with XRE-family HTH domain [Catenuloplanes nepalensis]|uniref:Transcriptional regulator with XRE-family HTH domain n=1 Tax=Catenuloplanes nepalensis TaxID=587533 RepID=A0ABT9N2Q8_9ACTN|nr:helix-turn-helix transcriptional regulator [Catenuloplanes nepalensis]MDP9797978.1 transcriptional regulator with XRE-family HTH domain [Catenuloplanes nepalensis]
MTRAKVRRKGRAAGYGRPVLVGEVAGFPVAGLVRRARRMSDMSQRDLARWAEVSAGAVARVETGGLAPSVALLERMLGVAGLHLVVVDPEGRIVQPMAVWDETYDGAGRRYPAHLSTILDPRAGEWWGDRYGLARPPETFHRSPELRERQRRRSVWEVRVAQFRNVPPPPMCSVWMEDGRPATVGDGPLGIAGG